jgi:hypothetical protein
MNPPREIKSLWWSPEQPETCWFATLALGPGDSLTLDVFTEPTEPLSQSGCNEQERNYECPNQLPPFHGARVVGSFPGRTHFPGLLDSFGL